MANAYPTLADIATLDDGIGFPLIDEVVVQNKELSIFPAETMSGVTKEISVIGELPTAGFRAANQGVDRKTAKFQTKQFSTTILEQQIAADYNGVIKSSQDPARALSLLAAPHMRAVMALVAKQLWYGGTTYANDALGFPGIYQQYSADTLHEVDAGGTTAKTSVWCLQMGPGHINLLWGNGQTLIQRDWRAETIYDANGKPFDGMTSSIFGRVGAEVLNKHSAVRIKNVGTDTGKGLTDALLFSAMQKFEELNNVWPDAIFCTPRSMYQLRASRTATTASVTGEPVPGSMDTWQGIPVYRTINLSNAE